MGNIFSGAEIVEIGVQIEKNGRDFYRDVAACSQNDNSKEVFRHLMDAEEQHIKTFQAMLASVKTYEPPEAYPGEYFAYMKALADEHIFTRENAGCEMAAKAGSDAEAIDMGMSFERDSIKFYEGMKKVVPEKDHVLLDRLIKEEQAHLSGLEELKHVVEKGA